MKSESLTARARGRWAEIFRALAPNPVMLEAIERAKRYHNAHDQKTKCPVHGGKSGRAFRVLPNFDQSGYCVCNSCNESRPMSGYAALMWLTGQDAKRTGQMLGDYLDDHEGRLRAPTPTIVPPQPVVHVPIAPEQDLSGTPKQELLEFWEEAFPFDHPRAEPARRYYRRRGFRSHPISAALRCHPGLRYYVPAKERDQQFPTLFAWIQDPAGDFVGLHGTVVTEEGEKAPVRAPKVIGKVRGASLSGAAIRLFEPGPILGVTEGNEKAWAIHLATGMPVWSGANAALLGSMVIPSEVQLTVIWADFDELKVLKNGNVFEPGRVAAERLQARLRAGYRASRILYPTVLKQRGKDWEDVWHHLGAPGFPTISRGSWPIPTVLSVFERWRKPKR